MPVRFSRLIKVFAPALLAGFVAAPIALADGHAVGQIETPIAERATGEDISAFLTGAKVKSLPDEGAEWKQTFYENGYTDFQFGRSRPSVGSWIVERDQYCSQWPPNLNWACYWVEISGDVIVWEAVDTGVREAARLVAQE